MRIKQTKVKQNQVWCLISKVIHPLVPSYQLPISWSIGLGQGKSGIGVCARWSLRGIERRWNCLGLVQMRCKSWCMVNARGIGWVNVGIEWLNHVWNRDWSWDNCGKAECLWNTGVKVWRIHECVKLLLLLLQLLPLRMLLLMLLILMLRLVLRLLLLMLCCCCCGA